MRNAIKLTFNARYSEGRVRPACGRLFAIPANNALTDMWRPPSETHAEDTALRVLGGILGRMGSNAFVEFWPDLRRRIFRPPEQADQKSE